VTGLAAGTVTTPDNRLNAEIGRPLPAAKPTTLAHSETFRSC
jgi:hypothetical protein